MMNMELSAVRSFNIASLQYGGSKQVFEPCFHYLTAVGVFRRLTCHMLQRDAVLFSRRGSQEMWQGNEG